jgi:transcriptional regulator with XRE-family HTH domain
LVNIDEFTNRLKKVMETHQLTATLFADKIGVQRSSISHILSGRNKPSLDFILKVTGVFLDVDIHWLLNGIGEFPKTTLHTPTLSVDGHTNAIPLTDTGGKKIKRIVVFYEDGTFDEYHK